MEPQDVERETAEAPPQPGDPPPGGPTEPDDRDVLEIELLLKDYTFDVTDGTVDEVDIKVRFNPRLKIGVAIVAFSFLMSGFVFILTPWALATGNESLQMTCGTVYFSSWVVLGAGVLVGGQAAKKVVTSWHVSFHKAIKARVGKLKSR
jgi:hypothetical protein